MVKYAERDYDAVTAAYNKVPEGLKGEANKILRRYNQNYGEFEAPPKDMIRDLEALTTNNSQRGLEAKANSAIKQPKTSPGLFNLTQSQSVVGLAAIVLLLAAASAFSAATPLATAYALSPLY